MHRVLAKSAAAPDKLAKVKAAMVNISLAPAIPATSTPAPAPEKAAPAPPAAANTRLAPVHLLILGAMALALAPQHINTLVPVPATPAAPAPLAVASIQNALAPPLILGHQGLVNVQLSINTPAPVRDTPVVWAPPAAENIPLANAPLATNGKMVVARNKHRMEQLVSCIIAMAKLLVYVLQVWISILRWKI